MKAGEGLLPGSKRVTFLLCHYKMKGMSEVSGFSAVCVCSSFSVVSDSFVTLWTVTQGSSVHGIFQARILEWVAIFYSRESS